MAKIPQNLTAKEKINPHEFKLELEGCAPEEYPVFNVQSLNSYAMDKVNSLLIAENQFGATREAFLSGVTGFGGIDELSFEGVRKYAQKGDKTAYIRESLVESGIAEKDEGKVLIPSSWVHAVGLHILESSTVSDEEGN